MRFFLEKGRFKMTENCIIFWPCYSSTFQKVQFPLYMIFFHVTFLIFLCNFHDGV